MKGTIGDRLRYRFDNFMSKSGRSIFVSLTIAFAALLALIGLIRVVLLTLFPQPAQHSGGILRNVYITFLQMTDPGSDIYLKPVDPYLERLPVTVTFGHLMAVAPARGEVCLGVKIAEHERDAGRNFCVTLVPDKNAPIEINAADTLVVLAEDET